MAQRGSLDQLLYKCALASVSLFLLGSAFSCRSHRGPEPDLTPPNILLIMADDLGYEGLSCNGSTTYMTPALDELARSGVRFTHCYSTPLCTPSRVQLLTGKYSFRNYLEFGTLPPGETTMAHLLREAGYATCVAGKWQLVGHYAGSRYKGEGTLPDEAGFDEHCLWQVDRLGSRYWNPVIQQNGVLREGLQDGYGPDVVCDFILDFIKRYRSKPFFVYYPMILTHAPFVATPLSAPGIEMRDTRDTAYFREMVSYADRLIGRIVRRLDELGLRDETLILFTCDNGSPRSIVSRLGERVIQGGKGYTTDAGTHVPLIANWRGYAPAGLTCDDLIDFTDFLPTLLDAVGASLPQNADGRSFFPQILGKRGRPRDWIFCHYDPRWGEWALKRFARDKRWKLYGDGMLYDLENDPLEMRPHSPELLNHEADDARLRLQGVLDALH
jgi:arylsulfatase A-like enzyme